MRGFFVLLAIAAVGLLWPGSAAHAAGFDCTRATNASDRVICATPKLSTVDETMARIYADLRAKLQEQNHDSGQLVAEQNRWLAMRAACNGDIQCLVLWYEQRIPALNRMFATLTPQTPRSQPGARERPHGDDNGGSGNNGNTRAQPEEEAKISTGSGYAVSADGHFVTNNHVIDGCKSVTITMGEETRPARVLAADKNDDLALLKTDLKPRAVATLRTSVRLGEEVAAFGFPLTGLLSSGGNFTLGNVTATAGMEDDPKLLQISAPVQPGNSGGPLVDQSGNVVGTVVSKLNALKVAKITDDVVQNVNFAIKASVVAAFLDAHSVQFQTGSPGASLSPADLADRARSFAIFVECRS